MNWKVNNYVESLLDNDLYKFSMQNAVCKLFPRETVRYTFINRDGREFPEGFGKELRKIIDTFREFVLSARGKDFLRVNCDYFDPVYLDFLSGYRYNPDEVVIDQKDSVLSVQVEGKWHRVILWEVSLMAVISQLYFKMTGETKMNRQERLVINKEKAQGLNKIGVSYADFGTRRRYSFANHSQVVRDFVEFGGCNFVGTSNVHFAMINNISPRGTMAHEWIQFHAAKYGYRASNKMAMKHWIDVYQGDLGIVLPDTFTTDVFLRSFNSLYARQFDGVRHDSGDIIDFTGKVIRRYRELNIRSQSKTVVFSDGINSIEKVSQAHTRCEGWINDSYGIGTWFSNDVGVKPLNMVIKMTGVFLDGKWTPTVKLSDDKGKNTGDSEAIDMCKKELGI